jgi:hypothetical protein
LEKYLGSLHFQSMLVAGAEDPFPKDVNDQPEDDGGVMPRFWFKANYNNISDQLEDVNCGFQFENRSVVKCFLVILSFIDLLTDRFVPPRAGVDKTSCEEPSSCNDMC